MVLKRGDKFSIMDEENKEQKEVEQPFEDTSIIDTLKKQADEYLKGWQTERANLLNYQRDENERISKILDFSERNMILEILSVVDNFDLLMQNVKPNDNEVLQGAKLIHNQLIAFLAKHNCQPFDSLNQTFDPSRHEAIETIKDESKNNNLIIEEIQKGYK
jgi:molecular chaperone GrpE